MRCDLINSNFNLLLVDAAPDLWYSLASSSAVINSKALAATARLGKAAALSDKLVPNDGRHGTLVGRFPFSVCIVRLLEVAETREALEDAVAKARLPSTDSAIADGMERQLNAVCVSIFGAAAVEAWRKFGGQRHEAYLHDMVAISSPALPGLAFEDQLAIYHSVLTATAADAMASPAAIHVACWRSESRLFHICSMLSDGGELPAAWRTEILEEVGRLPHASGSADRLRALDACVIAAVVERLWRYVDEQLTSLVNKPQDPIGQSAMYRPVGLCL